MNMERKKNSVHTLQIQGYTAEGAGVARLEELVIFVPGTIQGELWEVRLLKVSKHVAWGKGVRLLEASPERLALDCPYVGKCGGCQFRHMTYREELEAKRRRVTDALRRIGGVEVELDQVLAAEEPLRYRNKVQFPVQSQGDGISIGFYRARSHDVVDVEDCLLQPELSAALRRAVREWAREYGVPAYDEGTGKGLLRHLYLRMNHRGECLCCLVVNRNQLPHEEELIQRLRQDCEGLVGVVLNHNGRDTNVILGPESRTLWGRDWLEEELCGFTFQLSIPSFFQINRDQTQRLYQLALDMAGLTGAETVLDLYCGIGTISLCLAARAGRVIGAEVVPQAVEDARENARRNGVTNTEFICGDAGDVARRLSQEGVRPQVVCVDPPRKGLAPEVPGIIASLEPEQVVYISCDPATLARDVKRFGELGYHIRRVGAVDLFPRTAHCEVCVKLVKIKG